MTFNHVFVLPIFGVSFAIFVFESLNMSMNGSKYLLTFVTQIGLQEMQRVQCFPWQCIVLVIRASSSACRRRYGI